MKKKNKEKLKKIINDNTSGSSELLDDLNKLISDNSSSPKEVKSIIDKASSKLSIFSGITDYLGELKKVVDKNSGKEIKEFTESYEKSSSEVYMKIFANASDKLKNVNKIVTLSNSKTLLELIKIWGEENKNLQVTISESRPQNEGRILTKKLLKEKIEIKFITEALLPMYIEKADAVVIGADSVLANGNVVNKTGSRSAAIICKHFGKPFYVFTSKKKFTQETSFEPEHYPPEEVWKKKDDNLKVINFYFEEIENSLITNIFTD